MSKSYSRLITIKTMADLIISTIQQPFLLTSTELLHQIMITERMDCQESVLLDASMIAQWIFRMSNEVKEKGQIKRLFKRFELQHNIQRNPFVIWIALAMLGNDKKAWLAVFQIVVSYLTLDILFHPTKSSSLILVKFQSLVARKIARVFLFPPRAPTLWPSQPASQPRSDRLIALLASINQSDHRQ